MPLPSMDGDQWTSEQVGRLAGPYERRSGRSGVVDADDYPFRLRGSVVRDDRDGTVGPFDTRSGCAAQVRRTRVAADDQQLRRLRQEHLRSAARFGMRRRRLVEVRKVVRVERHRDGDGLVPGMQQGER